MDPNPVSEKGIDPLTKALCDLAIANCEHVEALNRSIGYLNEIRVLQNERQAVLDRLEIWFNAVRASDVSISTKEHLMHLITDIVNVFKAHQK